MSRKSTEKAAETSPYLLMTREDASKKIKDRIERGNELKNRSIQSETEHKEVQREYFTWNEYNERMLKAMFTTSTFADQYIPSVFFGGGSDSLPGKIRELHNSLDRGMRKLGSTGEQLELIPIAQGVEQKSSFPRSAQGDGTGKVFIVHGHDDTVRESVARFIERLELTPIILHEQASQGMTIVEKLEYHGDVAFAVILLTPDDFGGKTPQELKARARQNVVLELGYFLGRLGRDRVCALHRGELEIPSDYMGVVYLPFDTGGGWRVLLAKELKAAGFSVDLNKAM